MKINVKAFALTTGLFWGFGLLFITWWIMLFEGATGDNLIIGQVYRGYNVSFWGSWIGFLWGLIDGIIGGALFAWIYNFLTKRFWSKPS
jgi:hypothetical protein